MGYCYDHRGLLCCDRCGAEVPGNKSAFPYFNASCTDTVLCFGRQQRYRDMMQDIIAGLAGETIYPVRVKPLVKHRKRPKDSNLVARTAEALKARLNAEERKMTRDALATFGPDYSGEWAI